MTRGEFQPSPPTASTSCAQAPSGATTAASAASNIVEGVRNIQGQGFQGTAAGQRDRGDGDPASSLDFASDRSTGPTGAGSGDTAGLAPRRERARGGGGSFP